MLSEEDQALFEAARKAQLNRNTAIQVIDIPNVRDIVVGTFVRVLLELPSHQEGYMIARVLDTPLGEPYSGFSPQVNRTTRVFLSVELPRSLADINGRLYQLNSISNSTMCEGEFASWLGMMRGDPSLTLPTVNDVMNVAVRIRQYEAAPRHRAGSSAVGNSVSGPLHYGTSAKLEHNRRANSARDHDRLRQSQQTLPVGASQTLLIPPVMSGGIAGSSTPDIQALVNQAARGGDGVDTSQQLANRLVRQSTALPRDVLRNSRPDGQASMEAAAQQQQQQQHGGNWGGGGASASPFPVAQQQVHTVPMGPRQTSPGNGMLHPSVSTQETEDEEAERRIRQDIMNHLSEKCVLFPKDAQGYKLSRLRLVERDMIEYLQHVRDEIQGKQENCIVCLDHVPTVILLPCKHKVMCRLCAPFCSTCPVCRSNIAEMFEPEEI